MADTRRRSADGEWCNDPPPEYQVLMGRARMIEDFANILEDMGAPPERIAVERELAGRCWAAAFSAQPAHVQQLSLPLFGG